jgi:hypothetical protein
LSIINFAHCCSSSCAAQFLYCHAFRGAAELGQHIHLHTSNLANPSAFSAFHAAEAVVNGPSLFNAGPTLQQALLSGLSRQVRIGFEQLKLKQPLLAQHGLRAVGTRKLALQAAALH